MKRNTKITAVILSLVMLMVSFFTISASAADVNYSVTNVSGEKGDTVTVTVNLTSGVELWGGIVKLSYNSSELQYVSCSKGDAVSSGSLNNNGSSVTFAGTYAKTSGTVFTVKFKILKSSGTSALTLTSSENIDSDGKTHSCAVSNGTVTVLAGKMGDVNGNGLVTSIDARYALQYVVGDRELSDTQLAVADMNGDGNVTAIDARMILEMAVL